LISPTVGAGKWIGRISVSVSATEAKNFRRDTADRFAAESDVGDARDLDHANPNRGRGRRHPHRHAPAPAGQPRVDFTPYPAATRGNMPSANASKSKTHNRKAVLICTSIYDLTHSAFPVRL
jgi:hypothetical protein